MAENNESSSRPHAYSRKLKSLGLLCSNFVSLYNREDVETVELDDAATKLGVERRRIYDIVNVMESVGILKRKAKNRYLWIGFNGVPGALQLLKEDPKNEQSGLSLENSVTKVSDDEDYQNDDDGEGMTSTNDTSAKPGSASERREKSLGQLTRNFVKLLLTTNAETVSLDEAASLLLGDGQDSSHMRKANAAKVRRLYDIANVLSSLNLIEKTHQSDSRKPAFRWLGSKGSDSGVGVFVAPAAQKSSKRIFGTDLTNVAVKRRAVSSFDNKPTKAQMPFQDSKERSIEAQRQSKPFVFGPFNPPKPLKEIFEEKAAHDLDFESLASSLCPSYHNQEIAGGGNNKQQASKEPLSFRHS